MNKTVFSLVIKFVLTFVAAWISFSLFDNMIFSLILIIAFSVTIINYLIGDLIVLPAFGNIIAAIGNGGLAALTAYIASVNSYGYVSTLAPFIIFAGLVAVAEYFFHIYLLSNKEIASPLKGITKNNNEPLYNMEIAKEFNPNPNNENPNQDNNNDNEIK